LRWYHSVITKISLLFALAIIGIASISLILFQHIRQKEIHTTNQIAKLVFKYAYNEKTSTLDYSILKKEGFIKTDRDYLKIIQKSTFPIVMKDLRIKPSAHDKSNHFFIKTIGFKNYIYVIFKNRFSNTVLFKYEKENNNTYFLFYFLGAFLAILMLYIAIIRSLLPLKSLRYKIKEFANGNYDIDSKSDKQDEIALLANEFHNSVAKIRDLKNSRQLFLRNIMHELKTPIAKGKLAVEIMETSEYKNILRNVFNRQDELINDFSRIEKLNANEMTIEKKEYNLIDIIDYSIDLIDTKKDFITKKLSPSRINADFELFGVAIKNLLDNGINYSVDKKVSIRNTHSEIIISNKGNKLEFDLSRYMEPYAMDGQKQRKSLGLGFGLYITLHIIKLHGMTISYNYNKGVSYFKIKY